MYGEFCVTKIFTNADDIRLSIKSLLVNTTDAWLAQHREKNGKNKTDDSVLLVYAVYHFLFFCFCFSFRPLILINVLDSPTFLTLYSLSPC